MQLKEVTRGKKLPGREKLENTCTGSDEGLMYTIENNRRWVIYEALKEDQAACAGAARSFLNMGNAHIKLGDIMDAHDTFSQAYVYAEKGQDTRTMMQAYEALASIAMRCRESRAAREYLVTAMKLAFSIKGWRGDEGQGQHDTYDVQRITDKLSKLPVTMSAERFQEDFNKTTSHWSTLRKSTSRRTLITPTLPALSNHRADKGQGPSGRK
ncbi:uncharacterized protein LOC124268075 [Haliotis rubra]|uniref:uncharacterized protein LOC124268075 n=1 Tax=Haliotis rubra TaxID=36100 RepID=UPI001EE5B9E1|nr:uncharacterized protein LOC124268075 [Haliotis rubra]